MTGSSEMRIVEIKGSGGPEVLTIAKRPRPEPGPGEIRIKVAAAGVNRPDVFQRQGAYPPPPGAPEWPGLEVAGIVEAAGPDANRFSPGDRVMALVPGGGYAEAVCVHETNALHVPANLSFVEAAAIPETFFTVWSNVFMRAGLRSGESFLVHGGTSGIGTTAIQLAHHFGARVFATAGSANKCRAAEKLGADACINYRDTDFVEPLMEATGNQGVNVILDMVGGDYAARNVKLAAVEGRIIQIATLKGAKAEINLSQIMMKRLVYTGSTLRARPVAFKASIAEQLDKLVVPLLADGKVRPIIEKTYLLEEAASAHRHMDEDHIGKIVLTTSMAD
ncbi:putative NAD(P)H quinone oxidoreductase, PIG3 family [Fulvimarina manganoxydans]|uniref:Putative NAD(P)H quinone oxidoreductase, PIG3 family n=1 Tax=Fulvimarina manganoxydans TaxID=937218 RepID=A0A1W1YP33_9HYPH|nr:NAD(P)H-quinone oxidoreductase [Fulvimarina manganoxydans]MEE2950566.1 NAD(P)H-quinone oxidoreductase [Pseudomonadota bacterium]SMC37498.1 putative NAD(P)H quinone oxidoreductase, PIG3 family [Fulvimarina manganoxydans]